jgi:Tfp pilus assembly protein PilX
MIRKKKLGQAEFFGLVIIVFLLTIGMIFVMSLKSNNKTSSIKSNYLDQALSQNFINSMLNMRTECKDMSTGLKLIQLITNCAEKGDPATKGSIRCDNFLDSCEYAAKTLESLLNETLNAWGKSFYFEITTNEKKIINISSGGCNLESKIPMEPPGKQPFPIRNGYGMILLAVCKI